MMYLQKHMANFIFVLIISSLNIYLWYKKNDSQIIKIVYLPAVSNSISCHYLVDGDALPSAEDSNFKPAPNSIFFHETSCRSGLNSRQACAIESAARAHMDRQVYVLFSSPVSEHMYHRSCIAKIREFPNIQFARVHIAEYAKNTPLEDMLTGNPFNESAWPVEHSSDILRFLTLYKWGGQYLDTDVIVVKSFSPLGYNWVGREDNSTVSIGAVHISKDPLGRQLADAILKETKSSYMPSVWRHNGPEVVTRVLSRMCNTTSIDDWNWNTCQGINVYNREYFYPVHYAFNNLYFEDGNIMDVDNAYAHHFWNMLTTHTMIKKYSPYAKYAQWYCPTIYEMYGDEFGK